MRIITAWQCVSPEVTKKCCTSTAVDETDEDMLWNGNVSCKCKDDEGTACEDGDSDTDW
jgi:hypothetical protein